MSLMMMLAGARKKQPTQHTQTFAANGSFLVPAGATSINLIGHGAPGTPGVDGDFVFTTRVQTTFFKRSGGADVVQNTYDGWNNGTGNGTNYCEPTTPTDDDIYYYQYIRCYYYGGNYSGGSPPTTGPSATGFGKVFPGGTGGAAANVSFNNVPVTAGSTYQVVVPSGGSITITYTA